MRRMLSGMADVPLILTDEETRMVQEFRRLRPDAQSAILAMIRAMQRPAETH